MTEQRLSPLKCLGAGRDKDCISALVFYFNRLVIDDEMRFLHDVMRRAAICMPATIASHIVKARPHAKEEQMLNEQSHYQKYRGKCKKMSEDLVSADPSLTLVRGHYYCPIWGKQPHWWTKHTDGTIIDPTKDQFPSKGIGEYVEFDGNIECSNCGKRMKEEDADIDGNYAFCSYECHGRFVGAF